IGRASGRQSIQLSRAIRADDGTLLGVVVISVDPNYFTNFYRELGAVKDLGLVIVGTRDFVVRARHVSGDTLHPSILPSSSPLRHALQQASKGSFTRLNSRGPVARYVASFRTLEK